MTTYTVEIQASNANGTIWQTLAPAEVIDSDDTAAEVAAEVARDQNIAEGSNWRVRVWEGEDADTATEPAAEHVAGTSVDDLARTIADRHGIDSIDAAREVVTVHVDQIRDDADLWDDITGTLTDAGVELVTGAVGESYAQGYHATSAQRLIEDIANEAAAIEAAERTVSEHTARRDELIRAALRTELRRDDIATAAGIKPARLYQIRDGRR